MKYAGMMFLFLSFAASQALVGQTYHDGISVEGEAYQNTVPDTLSFKIGIKTHDKGLNGALAANLSSTKRVLKVLSEHSIVEKDVKTSRQRFDKHIRIAKRDGQHVKIHDGFDAETRISVVLRDFSHYDSLLKALVNDPDVSLGNLKFKISHEKEIQLHLIKKAYQDAHSKAEILAGVSGLTLGNARSMNMYFSDSDRWGGSNFSEEEDSSLMPGQIGVRVTIEALFAVE